MDTFSPHSSQIFLVRHAATTWNQGHRHTGNREVPLAADTDRMIGQLTRNLLALSISQAYVSTLNRCIQTIAPWEEISGLTAKRDERLVERGLGSWEGKSPDELAPQHPGYHFPESAYDGMFLIPEAESILDFHARVATILEEIETDSLGRTTLVSTHSGVIWTVLQHFVKNPPVKFWPANCSITTLTLREDGWYFTDYQPVKP